jgi:hypothetical protein
MRDYVPLDDGMEPVDFDEYYDYPARTARDVACWFCVKIERDPERRTQRSWMRFGGRMTTGLS